MLKRVSLCLSCLFLPFAAGAAGDAKTKVCEAAKKYVTGQEKRCPDEAAAVKDVTCGADTYAKVVDAQKACLARPVAAKEPEACHVLDADGKAVADLGALPPLDCLKKAKETMQAKCAADEKSLKFQVQRGTGKPTPSTVFCKR